MSNYTSKKTLDIDVQIQMYIDIDVYRYRCIQIQMYIDIDVQIYMYIDIDVYRYRCIQLHNHTQKRPSCDKAYTHTFAITSGAIWVRSNHICQIIICAKSYVKKACIFKLIQKYTHAQKRPACDKAYTNIFVHNAQTHSVMGVGKCRFWGLGFGVQSLWLRAAHLDA